MHQLYTVVGILVSMTFIHLFTNSGKNEIENDSQPVSLEFPIPTKPEYPITANNAGLRLKGDLNCDSSVYHVKIQIKAATDSIKIGTSSILVSYNQEVLSFANYKSLNFDGTDLCIADAAPAWDEHSFDGKSIPGKFNLTLLLSSDQFSCPGIGSEEWIDIGEITFGVLDLEANPLLSFDEKNTNFNSNDPNDGTNPIEIGEWRGVDVPFDCTACQDIGEICDDGDAATVNDSIDVNCNCVGEIPSETQGKLRLRMRGEINCEDSTYSARIQIRARDSSLSIGTSSVLIQYNNTVLAYKNYQSNRFDGRDSCINGIAAAWDEQVYDGTSVPGQFNLTLSLLSEDFSCPVITTDAWITIGVLRFELVKPGLNPQLGFDKGNTNFNSSQPNDGSNAIEIVQYRDINDSLICCPPEGSICNDGLTETYDDREDGNCNCKGIIPKIIIDSPEEMARLGPDLIVEYSLENWTLEPDGRHLYYFLDGQKSDPQFQKNSLLFNSLEGGIHRLRLELANVDSTLTGVFDTLNFIVCPPAGTTCDDGDPNTLNDRYNDNCECNGTPDPCLAGGNILYERWESIKGTDVSDLIRDERYPHFPGRLKVLQKAFELEANQGDNFGGKLSAYICPPQSGEYTFWISSDESASIWLSTDEKSENLLNIAFNNSPVSFREWSVEPSQKSAPIELKEGNLYYLEVLHKESLGDDHLSVAWTLPNGQSEFPISAEYFILPELIQGITPGCEEVLFSEFAADINEEMEISLQWRFPNVIAGKFIVEKSLDGFQYAILEEIDRLYAIDAYQAEDFTEVGLGVYYRIKFETFSGEICTSPVIYLDNKFENFIRVSPNPIIDNMTVSVSLDETQEVKYKLINSIGQIMNEGLLLLEEGINRLSFDLSDFRSGIYHLRVETRSQTLASSLLKY